MSIYEQTRDIKDYTDSELDTMIDEIFNEKTWECRDCGWVGQTESETCPKCNSSVYEFIENL